MRSCLRIISVVIVVCVFFTLSVPAFAKETREYVSDYTDWPTNAGMFDQISWASTGGSWNGYTCLL